ncbi:MAG TPA: MBL fold metallo-hydrolase [Chthoniobacterales bacterium]
MSRSENRKQLSVHFRGVRGSTPAPGLHTARYGGNTSCLEVRAGGEILILDAGTGIRALGTDLLTEFNSNPISATLLISHTHWDHIQGLPFFMPAYSAAHHIRLIAPPGAREKLVKALANQMNPISFPISVEHLHGLSAVDEFGPSGATFGPFSVRPFPLNHPGGCAGFRIEAGGRSFAYLPDHEPFVSVINPGANAAGHMRTNALADFLRDVDLLILDTQYTAAEYPHRLGWGHGCLPDSVALAQRAEVKHLVLFHHDPAHTDFEIDSMVEAARELAPESLLVTAAQENETVMPGVVRARKLSLFSKAALF